MTVHAYDPIALWSFLRRMLVAEQELRSLRCTDPLAHAALAAARRIADDLETRWLPLARSVLCSDPLGRRAAVDGSSIDRWLGPGPHRVDAATGGGLLHALSDAWPDELASDPAALVVLAAELRLVATQRAPMTPSDLEITGLSELLEALAEEEQWRRADHDDTTAISEVVRAIGTLLPHDLDELRSLLSSLTPYAAALVVQYVDLDPDELATVTADLLIADHSSTDRPATGDWRRTVADVLLPTISTDAAACRRLLELLATRPIVLHDSGAAPEVVAHVVRLGSNPRLIDSCTAQMIVVPHARWLAEHGGPNTSLLLADLLGPWLLQLGPLDRAWSLTIDERMWLLAAAIDDPVTLQRLVSVADRIRDETIERLTTDDGSSLEQVAALLGSLSTLIGRHVEERAEHALASWSLMLTLVGVATAFVPGGPMIGVGSSALFGVISNFPPIDPDTARARAAAAEEYALASAAAAVALAIHGRWVSDGRLTPTFPAPPLADPRSTHPATDLRRDLDDWLSTLPGGWSGPLAVEADRLVSMLLNAHGAGVGAARG